VAYFSKSMGRILEYQVLVDLTPKQIGDRSFKKVENYCSFSLFIAVLLVKCTFVRMMLVRDV
jgi:hypothetical protein